MPGKSPTVLAIHLRDDGVMDGCNQYRFRIPFEEMRRRVEGGRFDWASAASVRQWAQTGKPISPSDYDLWLLPRHRPTPYEGEVPHPMLDQAEQALGIKLDRRSYLLDLVRIMRGKVALVLEYDDDYWTGSRDLGYDHTDLLIEMMGEVDAITVSTPYLRKLAQRYAPGKPVYILPNCVNLEEWSGWDRWTLWPEDHTVIALTGSKTHYDDWQVLEPVLPRLLRERGNVAFVGGGFLPDYLQSLLQDFPDRAKFIDYMDYLEYPALIRQADIVLCPVAPDDPFNLAKSEIKAVEGLAASRKLPDGRTGGAVPITSDLDYYRRVTGGNRRGLTVAHTPDAWHQAITTLIADKDLWTRMSHRGYLWVRENRSIQSHWPLWWEAYCEIYRRKKQ